MNRRIFLISLWIIAAGTTPILAQETLYPVRDKSGVPVLMTTDHSAFVAEKTFDHKLTIGFPTDDRAAFLPGTRAPIVMLWLRIQNLSPQPMEFNMAKFTCTDEQGRTYRILTPDEALNRILAGAGGGTQAVVSKTLRGISLGRAGNKPTEEQLKEDVLRYSLQSGQISPQSVKEGLIYFEGPQQKKFTVDIGLGDLWSKPFVFANVKQK